MAKDTPSSKLKVAWCVFQVRLFPAFSRPDDVIHVVSARHYRRPSFPATAGNQSPNIQRGWVSCQLAPSPLKTLQIRPAFHQVSLVGLNAQSLASFLHFHGKQFGKVSPRG